MSAVTSDSTIIQTPEPPRRDSEHRIQPQAPPTGECKESSFTDSDAAGSAIRATQSGRYPASPSDRIESLKQVHFIAPAEGTPAALALAG